MERKRGGSFPHFFRQGGRVPHFFGLKFVQKLVHCCNWLLSETQCKIISVQQNYNIDLLQTLKHEYSCIAGQDQRSAVAIFWRVFSTMVYASQRVSTRKWKGQRCSTWRCGLVTTLTMAACLTIPTCIAIAIRNRLKPPVLNVKSETSIRTGY